MYINIKTDHTAARQDRPHRRSAKQTTPPQNKTDPQRWVCRNTSNPTSPLRRRGLLHQKTRTAASSSLQQRPDCLRAPLGRAAQQHQHPPPLEGVRNNTSPNLQQRSGVRRRLSTPGPTWAVDLWGSAAPACTAALGARSAAAPAKG